MDAPVIGPTTDEMWDILSRLLYLANAAETERLERRRQRFANRKPLPWYRKQRRGKH